MAEVCIPLSPTEEVGAELDEFCNDEVSILRGNDDDDVFLNMAGLFHVEAIETRRRHKSATCRAGFRSKVPHSLCARRTVEI